jgi:chromosome segregation ATPase
MLVDKYAAKSQKLRGLRDTFNELSQKLQLALEQQELSSRRIARLSDSKAKLKTENRRLALVLAETEGNLRESQSANAKLRASLTESQIYAVKFGETEARLQETELKLKDYGSMKRQLREARERLVASESRCQNLADALKKTQEFLVGSERQLRGNIGNDSVLFI